MNFVTHKAGGALGMLAAFALLRHHGMLPGGTLPGNVDPYVQLLIMFPAASWGSTAPDLDIPKSGVKERTPLNIAVGAFLHMTGAKHRSWQTHCLAITGGITVLVPVLLERYGAGRLGALDLELLRLVVYGLCVGIFSHLILDALTPEGIHLVPNVKIHLVPGFPFFRTGGPWEKFVCGLLYVGTAAVLILWITGLIRM